ncbi:MAG: glycosyltransferase [Flavobacteriaceae bacterium]|nr:glycosyltransferase [Flavobacteriaceae bacterium]
MQLNFSIIIPVYNRPQEIDELLASLVSQDFEDNFEVIIVEDGSNVTAESIVKKYTTQLEVHYFFKENSGAGASRNFGMQKASGNYFIILDSDVVLPKNYLNIVKTQLENKYTDAFGGPDAAHENFTPLQKAINYAMTSFLTTGGIRGKKNGIGKFQLRSFNLGMSKTAFEATEGFSSMKTGEDIDLTFRLWEKGFKTQLIAEAFVYHKRRTSLKQFFKQTFSFGIARPILNRKYPESRKLTFWFPSLFILGFDLSLLLLLFGFYELFFLFITYLFILFLDATLKNKSFYVGFLSILTSFTQFLGYGLGFLESLFFKKN